MLEHVRVHHESADGRERMQPSQLASIDVRVLMIHGAGDPRPAALAIAEALPQAELAVIPDAGHFPWIERPDEVATALRAFLSALGR
jgi:proline iminopeptidase